MRPVILAAMGAVCLWLAASDSHAKAVGACDTVADCKILARACGRTDGHTYKPAGEGSGICDDGKATSATPTKGASRDFAAVVPTSGKATCSTKALCNSLKQTCTGTYKRLTPNAGECTSSSSGK